MIPVAFFVTATLIAAAGLAYICLDDIPRIAGTVALITTLAAIAAAIPH